jgi:hypothetical protein
MKVTAPLLALAFGMLALPAANAQVTYTATDISGSTWEYDYTVSNTVLSSSLTEFTTFFTLGQYSNLVTETSPGNWSPIAAQPDPSLPADGFYDALALDSGLASGGSQSGFAVQFTYLGAGSPGSQLFNFVDSSSFATLFAGQTTLSSGGSGGSGPTSVPEIDPSSLFSAMTLLLGALAVMRGRAPSRNPVR